MTKYEALKWNDLFLFHIISSVFVFLIYTAPTLFLIFRDGIWASPTITIWGLSITVLWNLFWIKIIKARKIVKALK